MSRIVDLNDVLRLGTILGIWAHPDDESFTCGGLLAAAVKNGQRVVCITATKGEAGVQDAKRWPPERLGDIRAAELHAALDIIGIKEHHWLGYNDGKCDQINKKEAAQKITEIIADVRPDSILTFGPDGLTGHPDHQTVSSWTDSAVKNIGSNADVYHAVVHKKIYEDYLKTMDAELDMFFNIDQPPLRGSEECDICLRLSDGLVRIKCDALKAMPSQTDSLFTAFDPDFICQGFGTETFVQAH